DVVGEAGDGAEALAKAEETVPDVVLMDVRMPKRSGLEATRAIKEILPNTKILMLTISDEDADLYDAIQSAASGYLPQELPIAKELFISENTVKNHVRNILEKLHLHSRMEAVVYAVRERLLDIK